MDLSIYTDQIVQIRIHHTNLSCRFPSFPNTEVAHDPGKKQTQDQFPVKRVHVLNTWGDLHHPSPVKMDQLDVV